MFVVLYVTPASALNLQMSEMLGSAGRLTFYGTVGVEAEDYRYDSVSGSQNRQRLRPWFELNGRGYIWDPRLATFDAGVTVQRENLTTDQGDASYNLLGYRLNTTWFANRPYPLTLYASRSTNSVSDYWNPSYDLTTSTLGARWGLENRWLGRTSLYLDRTSSESSSSLVPRSEQNLSFGADINQKLRAKQWGESDLVYGYRHTAWDEKVYDSQQRQDYFYFNDHSKFGEKANLMANLTYYNRTDRWDFSGIGREVDSSFLGFNSTLNIQQTEEFRHYYSLGLGMNDTPGSQSASSTVSGGVSYRFNPRWQTNAMLGMSASSTETDMLGRLQVQDGRSTYGSAALLYSDRMGNYLVNGDYTLSFMQTDLTGDVVFRLPSQQSATHTATLGYTRMNSPLYADSLQLRLSQTMGEPSGSEVNVRYSVTSLISRSDMLQGVAEYRRFQQDYAVWNDAGGTPDDYYYYLLNSQNARLDFGWLHRFSEASSAMLSVGATSGESQGVAVDTRYVQARASMRLRSSLHWNALARVEQTEGLSYISGRLTTVESDLNYQIGKWQALARLRYRDSQRDFAPFKERSVLFQVKRSYGFRR